MFRALERESSGALGETARGGEAGTTQFRAFPRTGDLGARSKSSLLPVSDFLGGSPCLSTFGLASFPVIKSSETGAMASTLGLWVAWSCRTGLPLEQGKGLQLEVIFLPEAQPIGYLLEGDSHCSTALSFL